MNQYHAMCENIIHMPQVCRKPQIRTKFCILYYTNIIHRLAFQWHQLSLCIVINFVGPSYAAVAVTL